MAWHDMMDEQGMDADEGLAKEMRTYLADLQSRMREYVPTEGVIASWDIPDEEERLGLKKHSKYS